MSMVQKRKDGLDLYGGLGSVISFLRSRVQLTTNEILYGTCILPLRKLFVILRLLSYLGNRSSQRSGRR